MIANIHFTGSYPELAERLWDVAPDGTQTLIARGLYRPTGTGRVVFQLHANGWYFAAGQVVKLQLLGRDAPYADPQPSLDRRHRTIVSQHKFDGISAKVRPQLILTRPQQQGRAA